MCTITLYPKLQAYINANSLYLNNFKLRLAPRFLTTHLLPHEIIKLSETYCGNPEVKRAFLLSCQTGLRFVDILGLKYSHIKDGRIEKQQSKTGNKVIIDLNKSDQ